MRQLNLIISLSLLLTLTSCDDEVLKCEESFKQDYTSLKESFVDIYSPLTSVNELASFKDSITSFTKKYPKKCKVDGRTYDVNKDLTNFVSLNSKSSKRVVIGPKVVYGKDDRLDIADSKDPRHKQWAQAVAVQISANEIGSNGELPTETIRESMNLCPTAEFSEQINPGRCSGFLVAENILVTAGHCVQNQSECTNFRWVFGFEAGTTKLQDSQIYSCKRIISRQLSRETSSDFAVLELDRIVTDREPLSFRTTGKIKVGEPITVIGHPSGLPMKVAAGANVRSSSNEWYFVGNLDTFGGNSGSPVFNSTTGVVEGILVRGENDFSWDRDSEGNSCRVPFQCEDDQCRGEDVTKITKVTGLPKQVTSEGILSEFFENSSLNLEKKGIILSVQVKSSPKKYIAGTKFLDLCALHTASNDNASNWLASTVVDCKKGRESLLQVVDSFRSKE